MSYWKHALIEDRVSITAELQVREAVSRAIDSILDMGGVEQPALDKIEGILDFLGEWLALEGEREKAGKELKV